MRAVSRHAHASGVWGIASLGLALLAALYWALSRLHRTAGAQRTLLAQLAISMLFGLLIV